MIEHLVGNLDSEPAALRHGVAGIEREIEHRVLHLRGIGEGRPQPAALDGLDGDFFAERPPQHAVDQIGHQPVEIDRTRLQRLAARKGEQMPRQVGPPHRARDRIVEPPRDLRIVRQPLPQEIEIAHHHGEQIVEIVRHAAGQVAERLHLLVIALNELGLALRGDIGDGEDEAVAARQHGAAELEIASALRRRLVHHGLPAAGRAHIVRDLVGALEQVGIDRAREVFVGHAFANDGVGNIEQLDQAAVPFDQPPVPPEDCDAVAQPVE